MEHRCGRRSIGDRWFSDDLFPRRKEMATLLRFRGRIQWLDEESRAFEAPSRGRRRKGQFPPVPRKDCAQPNEDTDLLPFSIDGHYSPKLGVPEEELAELYDVLRVMMTSNPHTY